MVTKKLKLRKATQKKYEELYPDIHKDIIERLIKECTLSANYIAESGIIRILDEFMNDYEDKNGHKIFLDPESCGFYTCLDCGVSFEIREYHAC